MKLAQRERLALALRQAGVRLADLLLLGREQCRALGVVARVARVGHPQTASAAAGDHRRALGDLVGRLRAAAALGRAVAPVARGGHQVGAEVELVGVELRQALEHRDERLLDRVSGILGRPGQAIAEVEDRALVAVVEGREGCAVAGDRAPGELGLRSRGSERSLDRRRAP